VEYPNVKNAHIVPRTYLANWAVDGKIAVWLLPDGRRLADQPVENVGTRRRFYERQRPDGTKIPDVEWSLGEGERAAAPLLRSFDTQWPLSIGEKTQLAELFAYQLLRGPRWKAEYEERTRHWVEKYDREEQPTIPPAELEAQTETLLSDSYRLTMMFSSALTAASVFASMHWMMLDFVRPQLATCDEPVVLWPGAASRAPSAVRISEAGILECIEIRLPLSPTHGLLMTWADTLDNEHVRVRAGRRHAANFNAFTVAAADRQWFHRPGPPPPRASGRLLPLSTQLLPGYDAHAAAHSKRRARASVIANSKIGRELADREIEVVTIRKSGSDT
jgi:hypothetical protein